MKKTENFEVVRNKGMFNFFSRYAVIWRGDKDLKEILFKGSLKKCNSKIDEFEKWERIENDIQEPTEEIEEVMRDRQNLRLEREFEESNN